MSIQTGEHASVWIYHTEITGTNQQPHWAGNKGRERSEVIILQSESSQNTDQNMSQLSSQTFNHLPMPKGKYSNTLTGYSRLLNIKVQIIFQPLISIPSSHTHCSYKDHRVVSWKYPSIFQLMPLLQLAVLSRFLQTKSYSSFNNNSDTTSSMKHSLILRKYKHAFIKYRRAASYIHFKVRLLGVDSAPPSVVQIGQFIYAILILRFFT